MWNGWFSKSLFLVLLSFTAFIAIAENRVDGISHVISTSDNLNNSSWVWVTGAILFLVALTAVLRITTRRAEV